MGPQGLFEATNGKVATSAVLWAGQGHLARTFGESTLPGQEGPYFVLFQNFTVQKDAEVLYTTAHTRTHTQANE